MIKFLSAPLRWYLRQYPHVDIIMNCGGYHIQKRDFQGEQLSANKVCSIKARLSE